MARVGHLGARRLILVSALGFLIAGAALANARSNRVGDFQNGLAGWTVVQIDRKVPATRFEVASIGGKNAVQASAASSMSVGTRAKLALA